MAAPGACGRRNTELWAIIEPAFLTRPAQEWVDLFNEAGIPVGLVNDLDLALSNPQVLHREMVVNLEDGEGTSVQTLGNPIKLARSRRENTQFPPALGEHTADILTEMLGLSDAEIDQLTSAGVVQGVRDEAPAMRVG